jgi:hypothetical protein
MSANERSCLHALAQQARFRVDSVHVVLRQQMAPMHGHEPLLTCRALVQYGNFH